MIYVDTARIRYGRMFMSHMIADTREELHAMADRIGVRRRWFQATASTPHYDICQTKKQLAMEYSAVELERQEFVTKLRELK